MDGTKHEKLLNESISNTCPMSMRKQHLRNTFWFQKWVASPWRSSSSLVFLFLPRSILDASDSLVGETVKQNSHGT